MHPGLGPGLIEIELPYFFKKGDGRGGRGRRGGVGEGPEGVDHAVAAREKDERSTLTSASDGEDQVQ